MLGVRSALLACLLLLRCNANVLHRPPRAPLYALNRPTTFRSALRPMALAMSLSSSSGAPGRPAAFEGASGARAASSDSTILAEEAAGPDMSTQDFANDGMLKGRYDPTSSGTTTMQPQERDQSIEEILRQLESIQQGNPKKIVILGTRHCTFLHQQIVELLSYALVLSGNHVFTSGAIGTHTAVIRGALRAENQSLLTVILPQTLVQQPEETRALLAQVEQVHSLGHNDLPLSVASRLCNSELLTKAEQLIVFAFHDSHTLKEAVEEGKQRGMLVTVLWLD